VTYLRAENEIISRWSGNLFDPLVSICCISYNHESFIEDAVKGFLAQETDFPFEILIHDDASTDSTRQIIKKYAENYPNIIKPMYQLENQFSNGLLPNVSFNIPRAKGKFITFCEGDDYWLDSRKLQIQVKKMIDNKTLSGCFHRVHYLIGDIFSGHYYAQPRRPLLNSRDIILKHSIPTSAIMWRKEMLLSVIEETPQLTRFPVGDIPISILMSQKGPVLFFDNIMAVYRKNPNSLTHNKRHLKTARNRMTVMYFKLLFLVKPYDYIYLVYKIARLVFGRFKFKLKHMKSS
jgi:glycosyltransferase involved in cell wall biosynthesis